MFPEPVVILWFINHPMIAESARREIGLACIHDQTSLFTLMLGPTMFSGITRLLVTMGLWLSGLCTGFGGYTGCTGGNSIP